MALSAPSIVKFLPLLIVTSPKILSPSSTVPFSSTAVIASSSASKSVGEEDVSGLVGSVSSGSSGSVASPPVHPQTEPSGLPRLRRRSLAPVSIFPCTLRTFRAAVRQGHHGHHAYNEAERKKDCHKFFHFKYLLNCYPDRVTRHMFVCSTVCTGFAHYEAPPRGFYHKFTTLFVKLTSDAANCFTSLNSVTYPACNGKPFLRCNADATKAPRAAWACLGPRIKKSRPGFRAGNSFRTAC